ncbi:hypothetical protein Hanom_Chr05g00476471 [Helianthus anomalus]
MINESDSLNNGVAPTAGVPGWKAREGEHGMVASCYGACTRRRSLWDANCYVPYLINKLYDLMKLMFWVFKLMNYELMFWYNVLCFRCLN